MTAISAKTLKKVLCKNSNTKMQKIVGKNTGNIYWRAGIEAWQSAEVYVTSSGNVGVRVYDLDGNPMSGVSYDFTVKYTLYESGKSKKSDTKILQPNYPSGNITINTGITVVKGKSYYAKVEVIDAKEKYMDWDGTTETKILFNGVLIGDSIENASAQVNGDSCILSFTSSASRTVEVVIQKRKSGGSSSDWADWRDYYIFPNDGNQSRATMLIDNSTSWDVTTGAWYSKNENNYTVEWSLGSSEYYVKYILIDSESEEHYNSVDISPKVVEYNGLTRSEEFNYLDIDGKPAYKIVYHGNITDIGKYPIDITRLSDKVIFIYNGKYTRLQSTYETYLQITAIKVAIPSGKDSYTYGSGEITLDYDKNHVNMSGTYSAINAGSYTAYADLKDTKNTCWSDGTTGRKYIYWYIKKLRIPFDPTTSFAYDGTSKNILRDSTMGKYVDEFFWVDKDVSATNVGTYICEFGMDDNESNVVWDDTGNANDRTVTWHIYGTWNNPDLSLGAEWNAAWTQSYNKNNIYICCYDYPNGAVITSSNYSTLRFSGSFTLYKNGGYLKYGTFNINPNASGNLPIDTGVKVEDGASYYAIVTVNDSLSNNMMGINAYSTSSWTHTHTVGNWSSYTTTKKATCATAGSKYRTGTCSECGQTVTQTVSIPATGNHTYTYTKWKTDTNATCTKDGSKSRTGTCSVCGMKTTEVDIITKLGHNYRNGVCTRCSKKKK